MLLLAIERPPKLDYWSTSVVPVAVSIRFSIAGLRNKREFVKTISSEGGDE